MDSCNISHISSLHIAFPSLVSFCPYPSCRSTRIHVCCSGVLHRGNSNFVDFSVHLSTTTAVNCTHGSRKVYIPWHREESCFEIKRRSGRAKMEVSYRRMRHAMINYALLKWFQFLLFSPKSPSSQQATSPSFSNDEWKMQRQWERKGETEIFREANGM